MNRKVRENAPFSIIMSIYKNDRLEFVRESITSILDQSYKDFDLYILYDGPIEPSVKEYISELDDCRLNVIERNENRGLAISLNELLGVVLNKDYQFIARMDADDISMPERFARQIEYLKQHPDVDCVGSWAIEINADGSEYFKKQMPASHADCLNMFRKRDCLIHPTVMFRRSYFEKAGLYPEDTYFGEDTMMWSKGFAAGCHFANVPEYLLKFRLDNNFFNRRRGWKHARSIWQLRHKVNRMLGFGVKEDLFAILYALAKLMPTKILNIIYQKAR